jgi:hypothetical protein
LFAGARQAPTPVPCPALAHTPGHPSAHAHAPRRPKGRALGPRNTLNARTASPPRRVLAKPSACVSPAPPHGQHFTPLHTHLSTMPCAHLTRTRVNTHEPASTSQGSPLAQPCAWPRHRAFLTSPSRPNLSATAGLGYQCPAREIMPTDPPSRAHNLPRQGRIAPRCVRMHTPRHVMGALSTHGHSPCTCARMCPTLPVCHRHLTSRTHPAKHRHGPGVPGPTRAWPSHLVSATPPGSQCRPEEEVRRRPERRNPGGTPPPDPTALLPRRAAGPRQAAAALDLVLPPRAGNTRIPRAQATFGPCLPAS